jgi:uncharacterized protein YcbK (DUF882 family)
VRAAIAIACSFAIAGCTPSTPESQFTRWHEAHRAQVDAYATYLREEHVEEVVPMSQLLRTGRRWSQCDAPQFSVPDRARWAGMVPTLRVVRTIQSQGVIASPVVASAWRTTPFNRCEGGSGASKHLLNNALDFDIAAAPGGPRALCEWWRRKGRAANVGLGFYSSTQIHVDTSGFRTWGSDHTRKTSLCR